MSMLRKKGKLYDQGTLEKAVRLVKEKQISLSQTSAQFNIPKGSLHNKVHTWQNAYAE